MTPSIPQLLKSRTVLFAILLAILSVVQGYLGVFKLDPQTEMVTGCVIAAYMRRCGFKGWSSFWRTIYVLPGHENNQRLLRHERKHLEQIERDGRVVFAVKYLWWLAKFGYNGDHPYEVEARKAENG